MADEQSDNRPSGAKTLNFAFVAAIVFVAMAIIAVTIYSIDSLQKNSAAMHRMKTRDLGGTTNPLPEAGVNNALTLQEQIAEEKLVNKKKEQAVLLRKLEGSEIIFMDGLQAEDQNKFKEGVQLFSRILKMIPTEARSKAIWLAGGDKPADKDLYTAHAHQQRAFCYLQLKQYQLAIDDLSQAIKLRPSYPVNYRNRSLAYKMVGQTGLANADAQTERRIIAEYSKKNKQLRDDELE